MTQLQFTRNGFLCLLIGFITLPARPAENILGQFESDGDVGAPKISGASSYDSATQEYSISGAGTNMWFGSDQFHFLRRRMKGDFILRARVKFAGNGGDAHRKAGWMARASLDPDAPYADCVEHGNGLTQIQFRRAPGKLTEKIELAISNADVLQFERRGGDFTFSAARFGEPFVSATLSNFDLPDEVFAGLFVCSHNGSIAERALFDNVSIIRPAPPNFVPYHDYIGSVLQIVDAQTGKLRQIYSSNEPFEAPNWTRDGSALIYNVSGRGKNSGRLCRFDLAAAIPSFIQTTPPIHNNNDHVLSFDGSMLALSGQLAGRKGQSQVFTVPTAGGEDKLITARMPSYCHGWSPDGQFLVFTGHRGNHSDIYKIAADGSGDEIRLTDAGANDGSEFSPDGRYIYFSSTRTGLMQLWRMKPDGTGQEQILNDQFNSRFPHISPDGKWIAFISYGQDIEPSDHPYYKHVYIRLMSAGGGPARIIAYVYGGQGTINVPSWAPDSKRLAFVSNSQ